MARFRYVDIATGRRGEGKTTWQAMIDALGPKLADETLDRMDRQEAWRPLAEVSSKGDYEIAEIMDGEGELVGSVTKIRD